MSKKYFFDMDGTTVEYRKFRHIEELSEKNYFFSLKPEWNIIIAMQKMLKNNEDCYILTKVYPSQFPFSVDEKIKYVKKYIPEFEDRLIFVYEDEDKSEVIKVRFGTFDAKCILIDDFGRNLDEWEQNGGTSVKYLNGVNGTKNKKYKNAITCFDSPEQVIQKLKNIYIKEII